MSDRRKEAEAKMAKSIFISGDGWLAVFDLLQPSQLGLEIATISHRFNFYVDEHFKTRKWTLKSFRIRSKIRKNGTKEMVYDWRPLAIPQKPLPKKIVGFKAISIEYIDNNAIAFLHRFRPLFAVCPINLAINIYYNDRILDFFLQNIWPMLGKNIYAIELSVRIFHRLRQFVPSILNDCPSLRLVISCAGDFFTEFPADDNAMASDGQAVAKWLFTALPNNVPKVFKCELGNDDGNLASDIEAIKAAFALASSPVNFIVVIPFWPSFGDPVVPFDQINELTREQLALRRIENTDHFLLVRCPIVRNASKWAKWEKEAIGWEIDDQWNQINIQIYGEDEIGDGLLDTIPGSSDQQQK
ncbi:hypothetical protein niasHT_004246 [Heterodera trifolii]|uniref:Uncharacterized protein n=1 Tax=Heterodera trifolii TaxID=157864 RepID=A0ABD2MFH1_9BILA